MTNREAYERDCEELEKYREIGNREVIRCERCGNRLEIAEMEEAGIWEE